MAEDTTKTAQAGGARPSMLSLNIKEKSALYAAFFWLHPMLFGMRPY